MKNTLRNAFLGFLSITGILLVLFAIYGLITYEWNSNSPDLSASVSGSNYQETNKSNDNQNETETKSEDSTIKQEQEKTVMEEGDNPEIDEKIRAELLRIENEFSLWSDYPVNQKYYMEKGYHSASFTNPTGIDFSNIKFSFSFQDDYGNELNSQIMYDAPLQSGETIILPLEIDKSDIYGNGVISWEYELQ